MICNKGGLRGAPLISCLALGIVSGCKSTNSGVKDAATDTIRASFPGSLFHQIVPSDGIERYVPPGDGANGVPHTLDGLWWTDAKSIQYVISFKSVAYDAKLRRAYLLSYGPGMYSNSVEHLAPGTRPSGNAQVWASDFTGYDITFAPDFRTAALVRAHTDANDNRVDDSARNPDLVGLTMEFVEDGHWIRHTPNKDDYHLRRIVKADGTRDEATYAAYLVKFGAKADVYQAANKLDLTKSSTIEVPFASNGTLTFVAIGDYTGPADPTYNLTIAGDVESVGGNGLKVPLGDGDAIRVASFPSGGFITVTPKNGAKGVATVTATPMQALKLQPEALSGELHLAAGEVAKFSYKAQNSTRRPQDAPTLADLSMTVVEIDADQPVLVEEDVSFGPASPAQGRKLSFWKPGSEGQLRLSSPGRDKANVKVDIKPISMVTRDGGSIGVDGPPVTGSLKDGAEVVIYKVAADPAVTGMNFSLTTADGSANNCLGLAFSAVGPDQLASGILRRMVSLAATYQEGFSSFDRPVKMIGVTALKYKVPSTPCDLSYRLSITK